MNRNEGIKTGLSYITIIIFAALFLLPFLWLVSSSLKSSTELFSNPPHWQPITFEWSNYSTAFQQFPFILYLKNTLFIALMNIVGGIISNTLIAYGFSRIEWKHRDSIFLIVLITMMLPFQVTMIPLFVLFDKFGWIGTFLPLIIPSFFGNPFYIFLLRQFFIGIPKEISQSAKVDGLSEFAIYWRIILPLSAPVIFTVIIFTFTHVWGDFIGPLVFLNNDKLYTLSLGIQQLMNDYDPNWSLLLAVGVTMTLPVIVIFFLFQKYFIQGISTTGVKG